MHPQDDTSSERLMARYQKHLDPGAFDQIVSRFLSPALAVAQQMLSDRSLAEDAVQGAFLRVVRAREQYRPAKAFSSWFYAILRNVCKDLLRQRARQARLLREAAAHKAAPRPHGPAESSEAWELLAELPEAARAVLTLRIVHDLPFRDVAAALGISEEAAKKRAQRALRRLRKRLTERHLSVSTAGRHATVARRAGNARPAVPAEGVPDPAS